MHTLQLQTANEGMYRKVKCDNFYWHYYILARSTRIIIRRYNYTYVYIYILYAAMAPGISAAYYRYGKHDIITYYIGIFQSDSTRSCPQDVMKQRI